MVKKPKVREEYFKELKQQIEFWDKATEDSKMLLKQARENRNTLLRELAKLNRRYYKDDT